jgi:hypothetical protein
MLLLLLLPCGQVPPRVPQDEPQGTQEPEQLALPRLRQAAGDGYSGTRHARRRSHSSKRAVT